MSTNLDQIHSNGIGCFSGPEMVTEEGMEDLAGMNERRMQATLHIPKPVTHQASVQAGTSQIVWHRWQLPVMATFRADTLAETNSTMIKMNTLEVLHKRLEDAETAQTLENFLPPGLSLRSLVGNIYVTGCRNTSYMDLIGRLSVPSIKDEMPMPFLRSCGPAERGNFFFHSGQETPSGTFTLRTEQEARIAPSWLARFGNGYTIKQLKSVPMDSRQQRFVVSRSSPIVRFLDDNFMRQAARETGYVKGNSDRAKTTAYSERLLELRQAHLSVSENPTKHLDGPDLQILAATYNAALAKIEKEDTSKLTLRDFLHTSSIMLFRAHRSEDCFDKANDSELSSRATNIDAHYQRTNTVKFTIVVFLGKGTKQ